VSVAHGLGDLIQTSAVFDLRLVVFQSFVQPLEMQGQTILGWVTRDGSRAQECPVFDQRVRDGETGCPAGRHCSGIGCDDRTM